MWKKILYFDLLVFFVVLTGWALAQHGWSIITAFEVGLSTPMGIQMMADIVILATVAIIWMYRDARAHGRNPWPWIVLTLLTASPGALGYLLYREFDQRPIAELSAPDALPAGT